MMSNFICDCSFCTADLAQTDSLLLLVDEPRQEEPPLFAVEDINMMMDNSILPDHLAERWLSIGKLMDGIEPCNGRGVVAQPCGWVYADFVEDNDDIDKPGVYLDRHPGDTTYIPWDEMEGIVWRQFDYAVTGV
jgi:hypothetical protein